MRGRSLAAVAALAVVAGAVPAASGSSVFVTPRVADPSGRLARAAVASAEGMTWYAIDGHVHTDHSHDAGFFHQQDKKPENHDTFVADQLREAERMGEDIATLTDHRTYDQAYDPDYRSQSMTLLDGEEWGGYPHATAWGITEVLEQGADEGACGVARAAPEVRAQDGIFGVAHPEDGRRPCVDVATLAGVPIDHLEAFRAPNTDFWVRNLAANRRLVPVTGSDNHFKQLYGTDGGTGNSSTYILARAKTQAAIVEAVRAGRVSAGYRALGPRITTYLDAERDGTFDAITGGYSVPAGPSVWVAVRAELGTGHWLQILDENSTILAQAPVALPDDVLIFELPASAKLYRAQLTLEPLQRVSGPSYLAYEDTVRLMSAPVYLSAPAPVEDGTQNALAKLSDGAFGGFADVAASEGVLHAVWQQRTPTHYEVVYATSTDDGTTWSVPRALSADAEDARTPAIAAEGSHVVVVWENHSPAQHGGRITRATSVDGGASFGPPAAVAAGATGARPAVAVSAGAELVAWMCQMDGYRICFARRATDEEVTESQVLSSARARDGGTTGWTVPPRPLRHLPAAVHPAITANGGRVVVAWEDNREDPNPLRNGTPDDWGIYATTSGDGGATWSADRRVTPRIDHKPLMAGKPENLEGNPQRHADLLIGSDGTIYLTYQWAYPSRSANVYVQRSADGEVWNQPIAVSKISPEFSYKPKLSLVGTELRVVWQASEGAEWRLRYAASADGGSTFAQPALLTAGTGYAGYPSVADGIVVYTGEEHDAYNVFASRL